MLENITASEVAGYGVGAFLLYATLSATKIDFFISTSQRRRLSLLGFGAASEIHTHSQTCFVFVTENFSRPTFITFSIWAPLCAQPEISPSAPLHPMSLARTPFV